MSSLAPETVAAPDVEAALLPPHTRSLELEVEGARLHLIEYLAPGGAAVPVPSRGPALLLHGGMAHARWWDLVGPRLVHALRPFALDRAGHGDSAWTDPARYGWERDLRDIEAVMRALAAEPWVVIGHSQGGLLAVDLAVRAQVPIAAVVLVDVPLHPGAPRLRRTGETLRRIPQFRHASLADAVRTFKPFPQPHRVPAEVLRYLASHTFKPTDDGGFTSKFHWAIFHRDRSREPSPLADFETRLTHIAAPTLCLRGGESSILSAAEHAEQVARLQRGCGVEIAGTTHNLHVEDPAGTAAAILAFLR